MTINRDFLLGVSFIADIRQPLLWKTMHGGEVFHIRRPITPPMLIVITCPNIVPNTFSTFLRILSS
jgi:hypothetical protein